MKILIAIIILIIPTHSFCQDDCIFDQKTQNDDFLKGNLAFKNYSWDTETKTATIPLEDGDTLEIYRGGCMHFSVIATFVTHRSIVDYNDWEEVYKIVYWIAQSLEEFDYELLKKAINEKDFFIDDWNYSVELTFKELLSGYSLERELSNKGTIIILKSSM